MNHTALIQALAPFAAMADALASLPDHHVVYEQAGQSINAGHLRQAKRIVDAEG